MGQVIPFPRPTIETVDSVLEDQRKVIEKLLRDGGFHIDYASAASHRVINDTRANFEKLWNTPHLEPAFRDKAWTNFMVSRLREEAGLK